jgi:hypothetical protein
MSSLELAACLEGQQKQQQRHGRHGLPLGPARRQQRQGQHPTSAAAAVHVTLAAVSAVRTCVLPLSKLLALDAAAAEALRRGAWLKAEWRGRALFRNVVVIPRSRRTPSWALRSPEAARAEHAGGPECDGSVSEPYSAPHSAAARTAQEGRSEGKQNAAESATPRQPLRRPSLDSLGGFKDSELRRRASDLFARRDSVKALAEKPADKDKVRNALRVVAAHYSKDAAERHEVICGHSPDAPPLSPLGSPPRSPLTSLPTIASLTSPSMPAHAGGLVGGSSASLGGASLGGASLGGANLGGASLGGASPGGASLGSSFSPGARSGPAAERNKQVFLAQVTRKHGKGRNVLSQHDFCRPTMHWSWVSK